MRAEACQGLTDHVGEIDTAASTGEPRRLAGRQVCEGDRPGRLELNTDFGAVNRGVQANGSPRGRNSSATSFNPASSTGSATSTTRHRKLGLKAVWQSDLP